MNGFYQITEMAVNQSVFFFVSKFDDAPKLLFSYPDSDCLSIQFSLEKKGDQSR